MRTFERILSELDWPAVFLVSNQQFENTEGDKIHGSYGISAVSYPTITLNKGLRGKVLRNTIYHEIAHVLWPYRKHWWIYLFGEKMAGGGGNGGVKYTRGHTMDELPTRSRLLQLARLASKRMKAKSGKNLRPNERKNSKV